MLILGNRRWSSQPPLGAQINFGHPLSKGLTFYTLFNAGAGLQQALLPLGLPGHSVGTVPTPNWVTTPGGASQNWNAVWSSWYERGSWVEPVNAVSMVMRARRFGNNPSDSTPAAKSFNNQTNPFISYSFDYNPSASPGQDTISTAVTTAGTFHSGTAVNMGAGATLNVHTTAMSYVSGALKLYFNGNLKQTDSISGSLSYDTSTTGRFIVSGDSSASAVVPFTGSIYYVGVWNRVLTPAENEWLHAEPYAVLQPRKQIKYFFSPPATRIYSYYVTLERLF